MPRSHFSNTRDAVLTIIASSYGTGGSPHADRRVLWAELAIAMGGHSIVPIVAWTEGLVTT
jgi:hypothetical protein